MYFSCVFLRDRNYSCDFEGKKKGIFWGVILFVLSAKFANILIDFFLWVLCFLEGMS